MVNKYRIKFYIRIFFGKVDKIVWWIDNWFGFFFDKIFDKCCYIWDLIKIFIIVILDLMLRVIN